MNVTFNLKLLIKLEHFWEKWEKWWVLQILTGDQCRVWGCCGHRALVLSSSPAHPALSSSLALKQATREHGSSGGWCQCSHNKRQHWESYCHWYMGRKYGLGPLGQCHHVTDNQWIQFWAARNKTCFIRRVDSVNAFIWICHLNVTI